VEAVFDNTSTFFVRVAGREQVDLFNVSAGTTLRVTPHVFRDHEQTRIKLLVNVEDGNITGRQVDQIPVVERSTVNTQALIAEGESLLIGGMVRETNASGEDKVPLLGDVPVVGNLFKTKTSSNTRVERMFLITPRLAGTRTAPAQGTLGTVRNGATPVAAGQQVAAQQPAPMAPVPRQPVQAAASTPAPTPTRVSASAPAAPSAPANPAPSRSSTVFDLDAPLPGGPAPRQAAPPATPAPAGRAPTPLTRVNSTQP
jgi:type III secretion protein C